MITTTLLVAGAILSVVAGVVLLLSLAHAPEGAEDDTGFHSLNAPATVRNRYYCARDDLARREARSAKPFKAHSSPAA